MSMGSVEMVEEIVPYLRKDQIDIVSASCGGASHAPPACSGVRRRRLTLCVFMAIHRRKES